jgi:hypothetical protein
VAVAVSQGRRNELLSLTRPRLAIPLVGAMTMRKKSKPIIGRAEPYNCPKHAKRIAVVTRLGIDCCHVCYYDSVMEAIIDAFQRMMIGRRRDWWAKEYERLGQ